MKAPSSGRWTGGCSLLVVPAVDCALASAGISCGKRIRPGRRHSAAPCCWRPPRLAVAQGMDNINSPIHCSFSSDILKQTPHGEFTKLLAMAAAWPGLRWKDVAAETSGLQRPGATGGSRSLHGSGCVVMWMQPRIFITWHATGDSAAQAHQWTLAWLIQLAAAPGRPSQSVHPAAIDKPAEP